MTPYFLSFICWLSVATAVLAGPIATTTIKLRFYSETIDLTLETALLSDAVITMDESSIWAYYNQMESRPYQNLLNSLGRIQEQLQLNDWLYYELIHTTAQQLLEHQPRAQQTLFCWFLLSKLGYDTRLTYHQQQAYLYAYSEEDIFETPMIESDGRKFINLSSIHHPMEQTGIALNMLSFVANSGGKPFSFALQQLPSLQPRPQEKVLAFNCREEHFSIKINTDRTICEVMKNYPIFAEQRYFEVPMSESLRQSLLPQLRQIIKDRPVQESLEILASFTRSAFHYKEDQEHFGYSKPMIAEEVFHYPYSDCEDRSVLFYSVVQELLHLPMIIIAFADHLTVAVGPDTPISGQPILYEGRNYYICDPTGPKYSNDIGYAPKEFQDQRFEILEQP